jgi:electron transport complex protein RnfB
MTADIYERLARHLDTTPAGFPRTPSGVEMRILRRLFTPEDAELTLHLTLIPEEPRVIARRAHVPVDEATRRLDDMLARGLIYAVVEGGKPRYMATQFVVGFWEGQVNRLNRELVRDFEEYLPFVFDADLWKKTPQMRVIPVGKSIPVPRAEVLPYEQVEELVRARHHVSVSNCICRQGRRIAGEGCNRPMESCLAFGTAADQVTRSGRGRAIDTAEAFDILQRAEEAGLVLQTSNTRKAVFICACCGCCCAVLRTIGRYPDPATLVSTAFVAALADDRCTGCATCESRCQVAAIQLEDGRAALDVRRCIGCGLCVETCASGALTLVRKPEAEQPYVPKTLVESYLEIGRARGRFGTLEMTSLLLRSQRDRLLAR